MSYENGMSSRAGLTAPTPAPGLELQHPSKHIGILIFDQFSLSEAISIAEVFFTANRLYAKPPHRSPPYTLAFLSSTGGRVRSSSSMQIWTQSLDAASLPPCDALFLAGGPGAQQATQDQRLLQRLRLIAPGTRVLKAIGSGWEILAAAQLAPMRGVPAPLDTPAHCAPLAKLSNAWRVCDQSLGLDHPKGPLAAALAIIKYDHGTALAREVSERSLPGAWRRLSAVFDDLEDNGVRHKIEAAARWIHENYVRPISIADAARVATMSERNFLRCFKVQMGVTPSEYLLRARLDASCMLLAATDLPIDKIARRCGAGSGDGLAKIFRKRLSISPTEYRLAVRLKANTGD
jgi:transcriptional regulator GlxA family with amidase domain